MLYLINISLYFMTLYIIKRNKQWPGKGCNRPRLKCTGTNVNILQLSFVKVPNLHELSYLASLKLFSEGETDFQKCPVMTCMSEWHLNKIKCRHGIISLIRLSFINVAK